MNNEYNYYLSIIKPIEKKYNRICYWYSIFKTKNLQRKKQHYNNILTIYYIMLQKNEYICDCLEKYFSKSI